MRSRLLPWLLALALAPAWLVAEVFSVVTFNVENLHDADGQAVYERFRAPLYGPAQLAKKLVGIAETIDRLRQTGPESERATGPSIIVFNELENDQTPATAPFDATALENAVGKRKVADLLAETAALPPELANLPSEAWLWLALRERGLGPYYVYAPNQASGRGPIKNAVFSLFPITASAAHPTDRARDILHVTVDAHGHPLHVVGLHWKSGASNPVDEAIRVTNAQTTRAIVDGLLATNPQADIVIAGDFNSHYQQTLLIADGRNGLHDVLGAQGDEAALLRPDGPALYNLWFDLPPAERRSDSYRGRWGTLMQILVSRGLYATAGNVRYVDNSLAPFIVPGFNADEHFGEALGWVEFGGGQGLSDHFPVRALFETGNTAPVALAAPGQPATATVEAIDYRRPRLDLVRLADQLFQGSEAAIADGVHELLFVQGTVSQNRPLQVTVGGRAVDVSGPANVLRDLGGRAVGSPAVFLAKLDEGRNGLLLVVSDESWLLDR